MRSMRQHGGTISRAGIAAEKSFLHDAFQQLDEVLKRRMADVGEHVTEAREHRRQIKQADQMIQRWLVVFAREHLADICVKLIHVASEHAVPVPQPRDVKLPHANDEPENPSEHRDDSTAFFIFETLRRVLCAAADSSSSMGNSPLRTVPDGLVSFCFERLSLANPTAIRHVAGLCVGVLSRVHLKSVVELYLAKVCFRCLESFPIPLGSLAPCTAHRFSHAGK